ncbi:hypothetical protein [Crenothrix polyspora]|jgi:hypothetical protein|uniref:Lipoprotein n=1 Tax=Crenothrix polyspora TaxID=360316 RepID=A0A1R4H5A3_9GAMM|nr:hypothetical protein [Crenothrix polyspora]SJM91448.1 conserved exported hypothetical protein [Crenothrix polyspora]
MKPLFFIAMLLFASCTFAAETKNDWEQGTSLSDELIKKIQEAQYQYKKCVSDEMQKPDYQSLESRDATGKIIKQCEPSLAKMRTMYLSEKVPGEVADRHLKKMRLQTIRNVLQNMMYGEAARKAGQQK